MTGPVTQRERAEMTKTHVTRFRVTGKEMFPIWLLPDVRAYPVNEESAEEIYASVRGEFPEGRDYFSVTLEFHHEGKSMADLRRWIMVDKWAGWGWKVEGLSIATLPT